METVSNSINGQACKRPRLETDRELASQDNSISPTSNGKENGSSAEHDFNDALLPFHKFSVDEILFTDPRSKSICVLGKFNGFPEPGIVVAEKQPLTESMLPHFFSPSSRTEKKFQNDIYSQYVINCPEGGLGEMRVTTVYPATEKHIKKYSSQKLRFVTETPDNYQKITKLYAIKQSLSLDWVFNILDGKSEQENVIYDDSDPETGFVLTPDLKWDQKESENLYVLAIARKRGILSLRELTSEHLPILRNISVKGKEAISDKYGIKKDQLRAYFHYQPSYYHLHVHITHLQFSAPKSGVGEAHLLDDVIDNIENIDPLYYAKRSLNFVLKESSPLWKE